MIKRTLYFGNPSYLSLKNDQLVLKLPEVEANSTLTGEFKQLNVKTFPIEDIGVVVLDHKQITITQALLEKLLENNCAVITCDSRRMPSGLLLPLEGNTLQEERFTSQIEASLPLKKQLWQQTVIRKIENQAAVLKAYTEADTGCMMQWWFNLYHNTEKRKTCRSLSKPNCCNFLWSMWLFRIIVVL